MTLGYYFSYPIIVRSSALMIRNRRMMNSRLSLLLLALAVSVRPFNGQRNKVKTLQFMYLTAITGEFPSGGSVPAMRIALEKINANQSVLPGYRLKETVPVRDSQVS